ncbi:MAG TPA: PucR family transcriptional regulator [Streptosporangiaceae bacterium]|nr:PucR family transcriptional regulator [Streptosporangiaceae bacterium]
MTAIPAEHDEIAAGRGLLEEPGIGYPTVADILSLPVIRAGGPELVAGAAGAGRCVRWVHVAEVADIAHLLRGGELVLTTGIALPADPAGLARYIRELAGVGAAGLVVELVRRWQDGLPDSLRAAADRCRLPLITLAAETPFVAVTEAVAAQIRDAQLAELRAAEHARRAFTALTVAGAGTAQVLGEVVRTAGLPVILETLSGEVLAYDAAGADPAQLLNGWRARSRAVTLAQRTGYDPGSGWLVTIVGSPGEDWARLVLPCGAPPRHQLAVIAEGAASALAVRRLLARDREPLERQAHRAVLTELVAGRTPAAELAVRSAALGVPLAGRVLAGLAMWPRTAEPAARHAPALAAPELACGIADAVAQAARSAGIAALTGVLDDAGVRVLISVESAARAGAALDIVARLVHKRSARLPAAGEPDCAPGALPVVIGAGSVVDSVPAAGRTLAEAAHVARAALHALRGVSGTSRSYYRLEDVRLRGLLQLLREDDRLTAFADRELGALLAHEARTGDGLLEVLRGYCAHGGNISAAAGASHRSRTAYYQQLGRAERILGVSLKEPESMLSVYVALLAAEAAARPAAGGGAAGGGHTDREPG